ncbi:DUF1579 domain-containing protein [Lysobacter sp. HDW10]|uniref:DUF1579 domain-containing protein n=1 Tax=Lysobacter sp. HDW10 TaxID=2714936 RepID=UPI0014098123|nr:DUF1579 domain-containing protein [Lysobacter sp. HDW10]QIK80518.1 DUF1579 domain-containing protein [Lysobacter sp. HDW10]
MRNSILMLATAAVLSLLPVVTQAEQAPPSAKAMQDAQREALKPLDFLNGIWQGNAYNIGPDGMRHEIVQTERIGPMLDGTIKVIEGRGYNADGTVGFNAFAVLSYDVRKRAFNFRSYAMGNEGDFEFTPTRDGYVWKVQAGPVTIRYTAKITGASFNEVGDRILPDGKEIRFFEMNLKRVSDTTWPSGQAVPMK